MRVQETAKAEILGLASTIVAAYVRNHRVEPDALGSIIRHTYAVLENLAAGHGGLTDHETKPAIAIKRSVTPDYIVCLEDGKKFKSLKRHLRSHYNLSPEQYREKWGLPFDYPMVAPNYAEARSKLAKRMGLGTRRQK